jgi:hypothetical protein
MLNRKQKNLTPAEKAFLEPANAAHRQYEALRAFFVEKQPSNVVAKLFGYSAGSFRVLCHEFKKNPLRKFFIESGKGPQSSPKKDEVRQTVIELRKQQLSVYDIQISLTEQGKSISIPSISAILQEEGFAKLSRRKDGDRPTRTRPDVAPVADVRQFKVLNGTFRTQFGGLFLFLPLLAQIPFDEILNEAGFPGTDMIPASHAMRSLLALKLSGNARHSHVMSYIFDPGLPFFAGINTMPKRSFLTEYSCRIDPIAYPKVMEKWFEAVSKNGLEHGSSFDLDFHSIPFHGEDALVQKHYISKRSRKQKGMLAFLVMAGDKKHFCYVNANLRKHEQNDEILNFVEYWKKRTGKYPDELVFDSKLTTYKNLDKLDELGIKFITIRRRSKKMVKEIEALPASAWRKIALDNVSRKFKTPKIVDDEITIGEYSKPIRQITIVDLGHEEPTFIITNQLKRSAVKLIGRYAKRMIIENEIADGIDFFHMDALSSAVAMKVDCDLQLTLMASNLYHILGSKIGKGYESSKARHIFRDLIDRTATVVVSDNLVLIKFQKKAHNPYLLNAGFDKIDVKIPWWGNRRLCFQFG